MNLPIAEIKTRLFHEFTTLPVSDRMHADFSNLPDGDFSFFIQCVDDSEYSLREWCEALIKFYAWEDAESRVLTPLHKIEYLSCCVQGAVGTGKLMSLADVWMEYLNTYGVE